MPVRAHPVLLAAFLLALGSPAAAGEVAWIFTDHCVLQRDRPVPVWGRAAAGAAVRVTFGSAMAEGVADAAGAWRVDLEAMPASADPRTLVVEIGAERIEVKDVLVGDVWVCGGQSNMEWPVRGALDAEREIAAGNEPRIRHVRVPHRLAAAPVERVDAAWQVATPETIGDFTAVGVFFARDLVRELGVPIGLISVNWGGTRAEPWTERAALAKHPRFAAMVEDFERRRAAWKERDAAAIDAGHRAAVAAYEERMAPWWERQLEGDPGIDGNWVADLLDDSAWGTTTVPGLWEEHAPELAGFDGTAWYRRSVEIPADWAGRDLRLELGPIDDADRTWFAGKLVGQTTNDWDGPRSYTVPGAAVTAGKHTIAIAVVDTGGAGGMTGAPYAHRLVPVDSGLAGMSLAGEWRIRRGKAFAGDRGAPRPRPPSPAEEDPSAPGLMFDGMLRPCIPYAIRGALWYQGESNAGEAEAYRELLPLLITSWRRAWAQGNFPFGIVQLAAFRAPSEDPDQGGWAHLRDAQRHAHRTVPETGLVIAIDIGDAEDIHPRNKQEVGRRLALWALATVHGQWIEHTGPTLHVVRAYQDPIGGTQVLFEHARGLRTRDGGPVGGFGVAAEDAVFHWARAEIRGQSVILFHPEGKPIRHIRHAWSDNPVRANLVNGDGLPAEPFRWDAE